jgi:hypothetical protein
VGAVRSVRGGEFGDLFDRYFGIFDFDALGAGWEGLDVECGSGRWTAASRGRRASFTVSTRAAMRSLSRAHDVELVTLDLHLKPFTMAS